MKNSLLIAGSACVVLALSSCSKSSSNPDSEEGNWVKRGQFDGAARTAAVSFVINDTAYVGTGYNSTAKDVAGLVDKGFMKDFWKFNIPTDGSGNYYWTQVTTFPGVQRADAVGFNIGNKGFVGTGVSSNKTTLLRDFWEFDGKTWTQRADYPNTARKDALGFGLKGKGYITTGYDENGSYQKDLAMYDTTTKTWTNNLPTLGGDKRSGALALIHGDKAYIVGGSAGSSSVSTDMFEFDGTKWTEKEKIYNAKDDSFDDDYGTAGSNTSIARAFGVGFVIGDYGYITTGTVGSYNSQTWRYDFNLDRWVIRTAYERAGRAYAVGFAVKGRGFIGLGESGSSYYDNFDEFLPNETYSSTD